MSNWKRAYGWYGHILVSDKEEIASDPENGLVCVADHLLRPLVRDYEDCRLPTTLVVDVNRLGVVESDCEFWAVGHSFSEGFEHYGTVFRDAVNRVVQDAFYLDWMKSRYGIDLPPCQAMVGCSSEH